MNAREWIDAFAAEIGADAPSDVEVEAILDLAAVAAHSSERIAAPVACWMGGRVEASLAELQAAAKRVGGDSGRGRLDLSGAPMKVAELWRYPVKGLRGERLERLEIAADGVPGDRSRAGRRRARHGHRPAQAAHDRPAGDPRRRRRAADRRRSDGIRTAAAEAIREVAGAGARPVRAEGGHAFDAAPILVVTDGGIAQLGYDLRRFRPNIVIEGVDGPADQDWLRGRLRIGEALLFVDEPCERCVITTIDPDTTEVDLDVLRRARLELGGMMGVYCSVLEPGAVAVGDEVTLTA